MVFKRQETLLRIEIKMKTVNKLVTKAKHVTLELKQKHMIAH